MISYDDWIDSLTTMNKQDNTAMEVPPDEIELNEQELYALDELFNGREFMVADATIDKLLYAGLIDQGLNGWHLTELGERIVAWL